MAGFPGGGFGAGHHDEQGAMVVAVEGVDGGHGLGGEVVGGKGSCDGRV